MLYLEALTEDFTSRDSPASIARAAKSSQPIFIARALNISTFSIGPHNKGLRLGHTSTFLRNSVCMISFPVPQTVRQTRSIAPTHRACNEEYVLIVRACLERV